MKQQANIAQVHTTRNKTKTKPTLQNKTKTYKAKHGNSQYKQETKQKNKTNERSCKTETIKP